MRRLSPWSCRTAAGALALALFTHAASAGAASAPVPVATSPSDDASPDADGPATAVVVLIGPAADGAELGDVLSELLERQRIRPEIVLEERFDPGSLLSEGEADSRVWVFIVLRGEHQARLYFRGPLGKRFLLREVALKNGLDEVGRELIAQIVETSSVALLHSTAGITRDEAKASLAKQGTEHETPPAPAVKPKPAEPHPSSAPPLAAVVAARGVLVWNHDGGPAVGAGAETGLGTRFGKSFVGRARLVFEYRAPQTIKTPELDASFGSVALRAGIDGGFAAGPHAFLLGLGAGVDFDRVSTDAVHDPALSLSPESNDVIGALRGELRYEVTVGSLWLATSVLADFATAHTHYDIARPSGTSRLAELWLVRPGIGLGIGWTSAAL